MDLSGPTAKRVRVGLKGSTLPDPRALQKDSSTLLRAPPSNGLQVGKGEPKNKAEKRMHGLGSSLLRWLLAAVCSRCRRTQIMRKGRTSSSR